MSTDNEAAAIAGTTGKLRVFLRNSLFSLLAIALLAQPGRLPADQLPKYAARPAVQAYIREVAEQTDLTVSALETLFADLQPQQKVLERISRPAEKTLTWKDYRPIFIQAKRINAGKEFMAEHKEKLAAVEQEYGVPAEIIAAIIGVETFYGRITGRDPVLAALATLAFDYPPRAKFFRRELTEFLLLSQEEGFDPQALKGSYAGAMGMPQFISSSYRRYAVDADDDGKRDLWNSDADILGSVANYLVQHGWVTGDAIAARVQPSGSGYRKLLRKSLKPSFKAAQLASHGVQIPYSSQRKKSVMELQGKKGAEVWVGYQNFYAITRYNHSKLYAMAVYELSEAIKQ